MGNAKLWVTVIWIIAPQIGCLGTLWLSSVFPDCNGHVDFALWCQEPERSLRSREVRFESWWSSLEGVVTSQGRSQPDGLWVSAVLLLFSIIWLSLIPSVQFNTKLSPHSLLDTVGLGCCGLQTASALCSFRWPGELGPGSETSLVVCSHHPWMSWGPWNGL